MSAKLNDTRTNDTAAATAPQPARRPRRRVFLMPVRTETRLFHAL